MSVDLILYSTAGCHLCEKAENMVISLLKPGVHTLDIVDIADSDELMATYGLRIPVLYRRDTREEIGWPFAPEDILDLILSTGT